MTEQEVKKMTEQEVKKMAEDLSDYKKSFFGVRRKMQSRSIRILESSFMVWNYDSVKC